jgi:hypothetical protein
MVEYDKSGIHRLIAALSGNHCARMAAQAGFSFEQRNAMALRHKVGARQPRNAPADYRNPPRGHVNHFKGHSVSVT